MLRGEGRFNSADPYKANSGGSGDPSNPHSWNRYAYVHGDPTNFMDSTGQYECAPEGCSDDPNCDNLDTKSAPGTGPCHIAGGGGSYLTTVDIGGGLQVINPAGSRSVRRRIGQLENALDDDCVHWLTRSPLVPDARKLYGFLEQEKNEVGVGTFLDSLGGLSHIIAQSLDRTVAGFNIFINNAGAYFQSNQAESGIGDLRNGTARFQAFTLIHEFAHELGIPQFLPEGGAGSVYLQTTEANNDKLIFDNCGKTLAKFNNGILM